MPRRKPCDERSPTETAGAIMEQWVSAQESLLDAWNNVSAKLLVVDQLRADIALSGRFAY